MSLKLIPIKSENITEPCRGCFYYNPLTPKEEENSVNRRTCNNGDHKDECYDIKKYGIYSIWIYPKNEDMKHVLRAIINKNALQGKVGTFADDEQDRIVDAIYNDLKPFLKEEYLKSSHERIRTNSNQAVSSDNFENINKSTPEIGKVVETIDEISEQTNLLALNATIEATRAGDTGKVFTAVANEIMDFAKQTTEATLQIKRKFIDNHNSEETISEIEEVTVEINNVNKMILLLQRLKSSPLRQKGFRQMLIMQLRGFQRSVKTYLRIHQQPKKITDVNATNINQALI